MGLDIHFYNLGLSNKSQSELNNSAALPNYNNPR